jgi:integrase/recombinase XerD
MSLQRFSWTEPVLCHYNYSMDQSWFVYFNYTDHLTGCTVRKQFRGRINYIKSKEERIRQGNALRLWWKKYLETGYNPMVNDDSKKLPIHYSVSEAFNRILEIKLPSLRKRAKETYSFINRTFQAWLVSNHLQHVLLKEFSHQLASQYMDYLIMEKKYAGRTHNDHLLILKTFCNAMIEREWIDRSPFKKISKKPVTIGRNLAYTEKERELLKKYLYKNDREMYYFSQIMYYCFIRRSELAGLKIGDIDLVNHTITIPAEVSKNKSQESVIIPVGLEQILREMNLSQYSPDQYLFGRKLVRSYLQYKNPNHISTRHNKFVKKLEIDPEKGLYSWKHTGACIAYYATNKDVYAVMRQLRHRDLNTTMIYLKSLGIDPE